MPTESVESLIRREADKQGVPAELALAVAEQESAFNPTSIGPKLKDGQQAIGTFQILPSTAKGLGVDPHDPLQNISGGVKYLRQLLDQHNGDLNAVLSTYGGVRTNTTYVPGVLARLPKFKSTGPPPAPGSLGAPIAGPPPSTFGRLRKIGGDILSGLDPRTREGRQNLAGAVGGMGGAVLGGPVGSAAGAGLAGAAEDLGEQAFAGEDLDPVAAAKAGGWQAAYDVGGQALAWPLKAVGKRILGSSVAKSAKASLESARTAMLDRLTSAFDSAQLATDTAKKLGAAKVGAAKTATAAVEQRFSQLPPAVTGQQAGQLAEQAIRGPAKSALNSLGDAVETTAAHGPEVPTAPLRDRLAQLKEQITPSVAHQPEADALTVGGSRMSSDQVMALATSHPELGISTIPPDHPLPGVIGQVEQMLTDHDTIPFADAHKMKRALDEAVNWDSPAKKQIQQATKGFRQTLRSTMADVGHAPYESATAAYESAVQLHRKGIAPGFLKTAMENPERIVTLIKGTEPTKAAMLRDLLVGAEEKGGAGSDGETAWNAVRAAWTHQRLIQGGLDKLPDRIAKLDPDFVQAMYGDTGGKMVLDNLRQIGEAFQQATAREAAAEASAQASVAAAKGSEKQASRALSHGKRPTPDEVKFGTSSLVHADQQLRQGLISGMHIAIFPHSPFTPVRAGELTLKGPKMADIVEWASRAPLRTQLLVKALNSPLPAQAMADVARLAGTTLTSKSDAPGGPPAPRSPITTPPPKPTTDLSVTITGHSGR